MAWRRLLGLRLDDALAGSILKFLRALEEPLVTREWALGKVIESGAISSGDLTSYHEFSLLVTISRYPFLRVNLT
jgi:hypothetical protein